MVKLIHPDSGHEVDTKGMEIGEYNTKIAQGYATKDQLKAREAADKEELAKLKAADKVDPAAGNDPIVA
jgi:hypothetical protein